MIALHIIFQHWFLTAILVSVTLGGIAGIVGAARGRVCRECGRDLPDHGGAR